MDVAQAIQEELKEKDSEEMSDFRHLHITRHENIRYTTESTLSG